MSDKDNFNAVIDETKTERKYVLRRLTPKECGRLQGFPDTYCDGVKGSDSNQYKMWGNGMALPNMQYFMDNIAECEREGK